MMKISNLAEAESSVLHLHASHEYRSQGISQRLPCKFYVVSDIEGLPYLKRKL